MVAVSVTFLSSVDHGCSWRWSADWQDNWERCEPVLYELYSERFFPLIRTFNIENCCCCCLKKKKIRVLKQKKRLGPGQGAKFVLRSSGPKLRSSGVSELRSFCVFSKEYLSDHFLECQVFGLGSSSSRSLRTSIVRHLWSCWFERDRKKNATAKF